MPVFIVIGNWTNEGLKTVKDAPSRIRKTHKAVEAVGGKMQLYYILGDYDFIMTIDVPTDESIVKVLAWLGSKGFVRTKTLKAWPEDEGSKILSEMVTIHE